ncbi:hypothetical protein AT5A_17396 [Agrobacterium tumefaciens 5A]|nr:hypothetical protein AT5A_17396 [Agrobacterium tumefaciens 5A]
MPHARRDRSRSFKGNTEVWLKRSNKAVEIDMRHAMSLLAGFIPQRDVE